VFPTLWSTISTRLRGRSLTSCIEVYYEIKKREDNLFAWVEERKGAFIEPNDDTITQVLKVMEEFPNFGAQDGPATQAADPWLIAHAIETGSVVVTDERRAKVIKLSKPPKIPDVCDQMGVRWLPIVDFLSEIGIKF
jgi:hypothetical protein